MSLTLRGIKQSALTHGELDNNFLWLKGRDIVNATLVDTNLVLTKDDTTTFNVDLSSISGGNMWYVPYGYTLTVQDNFQSFIYGDLYVEGTIDLQTNSQLVVLNGDIHISGGTVTGTGDIYNISIPEFDTKISGLTYSGNVLTIYQNDGSTYSTTIVSSTDITVTGGTYNPTTGTATFYDNNGGNFDVNGFLTGYTDVKVSGLTYSGDTLTLTQTDGSNFNVIINSSTPFTGNTSGDCITDLYVTNLNSCSPLHIQPVNTGDVYISENGGNVGIGTSSPTSNLHIKGIDSTSSNYGLKVQNSGGTNTLQVRNDGLVEFGDTSQPYNTWLQYAGGTLKLNYNTTSNFYWNGSDLQLTGLNGNGNSKLEFTSITARQQTLIRSYNTEKLSFATNGGNANIQLSSNGDLYIGNDTSTGVTASARLEVRGSGTTSSGYGLKVQDSLGTDNFVVRNDGNVGIGTSSPTKKLHVSGDALFSSSTNNVVTIIGSGSSMSSPLFNVQGSSGQLFSVSDSLIGSLFSVNDISGLPILEVFSDNTILMGDFNSPSLNTTKKVVVNSGVTPIYSIPSSGYTGAFYDYTVLSSLGARSGNIMSIWSGTSIQYSETSTTSIGDTSGIIFSVSLSGDSSVLSTSANTNSWTVKTIVRSI